jgi:hypothetical protein
MTSTPPHTVHSPVHIHRAAICIALSHLLQLYLHWYAVLRRRVVSLGHRFASAPLLLRQPICTLVTRLLVKPDTVAATAAALPPQKLSGARPIDQNVKLSVSEVQAPQLHRGHSCRKQDAFSSQLNSYALSRACLGKLIFLYEMAPKRGVFRTWGKQRVQPHPLVVKTHAAVAKHETLQEDPSRSDKVHRSAIAL